MGHKKLQAISSGLRYGLIPSVQYDRIKYVERQGTYVNGSAGFGKRVTCQISRNGDLIHRVYLQVTVPNPGVASYVDYAGLRLIKNVEIEIGGQRIDKHYSEWMYIWNELSLPTGKRAGYDKMVGSALGSTDAATTLYVPLEFWFCRNVGLALPLIALQYHEVKINIDFETKANVLTGTLTSVGDLEDAALWVDYIFLDTDERRRFAQLSHEYLIEQLQFTGDESITGSTNRVKLNFNHPCKELVWVVLDSQNDWNDFTYSSANPVTTAKLQLNGHDRFAERDGDYFALVQPFQHHENVPVDKAINVYSFALRPEEHQPTGTLNMSRIDTAVLSLATATSDAKVKVFAVNYNVLRIMSGMGGLALPLWCVMISTFGIGHKSYLPEQFGFLFWINQLYSQLHACKESVASGKLVYNRPQNTLLFGKPLRASSTKVYCESINRPRVMNLGMVKMMMIGQPAWLWSNPAKGKGYDQPSETERVLVFREGLAIRRRLKIQSIPLGKLRGIEIPTKQCHRIYMPKLQKVKHKFIFLDILFS